jgi:hypothetical protein
MSKKSHAPRKDDADRRVETSVNDSFPASDPPSHSGIPGIRDKAAADGNTERDRQNPPHQRGDEARPTGYPTSDRHAAETAHQWESEIPVRN